MTKTLERHKVTAAEFTHLFLSKDHETDESEISARLQTENAPSLRTEIEISAPARQKTILCLDTNLDNLELMRILFFLDEYQLIPCTNVEAALSHLRNGDVSALILESWLFGIDVYEFCSKARKIDSKLPIIFFTTDSRIPSREKALDAGADAYLIKPNDLERLIRTVTNLIKHNEQKRHIAENLYTRDEIIQSHTTH